MKEVPAAHAGATCRAAPGARVRTVVQETVGSGAMGARPTVMDLCTAYVARLRAEQRPSARHAETTFMRHIHPSPLASTPACEATAAQFTPILQDLVASGHTGTAWRLRSHLHAAYAQALRTALDPSCSKLATGPVLVQNPIARIAILARPNRGVEPPLSESDWVAFWRHLHSDRDAEPSMAHRWVRLSILLFGQGCQPLLRVPLTDVDLARSQVLLHIGTSHQVTPREHLLQAGPRAVAELRWLVAHAASLQTSNLFAGHPSQSHLHPGTVSRFVHHASVELMRQGHVSRPFTYRDVRQGIHMLGASLGIGWEVRAQLQARVGWQPRHRFIRYDYQREMREALVKWETFLASL